MRCAVLYICNRIVIIKFAVIFEGKPLQFCFPQRDLSYHCVAHHTSALTTHHNIYIYVITYSGSTYLDSADFGLGTLFRPAKKCKHHRH